MKQITTLLIIFLFATQVAEAQVYIYQRGLVTVSAGVAVPAYDMRNFKGFRVVNYAKNGTSVNAEIAYFYSRHVGVAFLTNFTINKVDELKLANSYLISNQLFTSVNVQSESIGTLAALAGVVFDIPVNKYFSFIINMMVGLNYAYKPAVLVNATTVFSNLQYYETRTNDMKFVLYNSAGAKLKLFDQVSAHIKASYVGSTYNFEYKKNTSEIKQESHMGILSLLVGISYLF